MKLTIELNDADLQSAVEAHVAKAIASLSHEEIERQVAEIITKKFDRGVDSSVVESVIGKTVKNEIMAVMGNTPYAREAYVGRVCLTVAKQLMKSAA